MIQDQKSLTNDNTLPDLSQGVDMQHLIGRPHLFCRYCETRDGFINVPIGVMTLQPDGRVTGYANPNEGYWKPYAYGTTGADRAFAFVGAGNKFMPSSTWQQTFRGMPVGYYCGEPEMPQKLCLVPHNDDQPDVQLIYVIATCLHFYEQTVPVLIRDLLADGVEPSRIKVVVNGSTDDHLETAGGVDYAFTTHNAWELSALYAAPLHWQFDYAMLIHDTSQVYPGFKRRVENFNRHIRWDILPASAMARCIIGLYAFDFLQKIHGWLEKLDGMSKTDAIIAEVAGELLHRASSVMVMGDVESNGSARQTEWRETADFFNMGTPRVRRVFPAINLHKFTHIDLKDAMSL